MQGELVLGCVAGDGDVALEGWAVVSVSNINYVPHPLQALSCVLADTGPIITSGCNGEPEKAQVTDSV
jgi:hypothetical protein